MFTPILLAVAVASVMTPGEVDPVAFQAYGRWHHPIVDAAVARFLAHDTRAAERARLASDPALQPYLFLAARRKAEDAPPKAVAALDLIFSARIRERELPSQLDSLLEHSILSAAEPKAFSPVFRKIHDAVDGLREHPLTKDHIGEQWAPFCKQIGGSFVGGGDYLAARFSTLKQFGELALRTRDQVVVGECLDLGDVHYGNNIPTGVYLLRSGVKRSEKALWDDYNSHLMICGDSTRLGGMSGPSVVIVDGDLTLTSGDLHRSLFVATGSIYIQGEQGINDIQNSTFVAGGRIVSSRARDCSTLTFVAGEKIDVRAKDEKKPGVRHEESKQADLGLRFFKSEDVGVTFDPDLVRPVVKAVAADSPLRGVLKPGDELTQVNGRKLANTGDARRALREAAALEFAFVARSRDKAAPSMALAQLTAPKAKPAVKK